MVTGVSTLPLSVPSVGSPLALGPSSPRPTLGPGGFLTGGENRLLAAVLERWCHLLDSSKPTANPLWQRLASPLALVAASGCGKTHLGEGLAEKGGAHARFVTGVDLKRDFANAVESQSVRSWRERWARLPLLVIDDFDHMSPGKALGQELHYLMDEIELRGHKLVVTSARPIAHLRGWGADLVDRFAAGLTLEIAPLDPATREVALRQAAQRLAWRIDGETLVSLAARAPSKPRELMTFIAQLEQHFPPRGEVTAAAIDEFVKRSKVRSAPELLQIIRLVSRYYNIPQKVLVSASRQANAVAARSMVVYLARQLTTASYEQIAQRLGGRDHTTIMHNYQRVCERLEHQPALRQASDELQALLRR
jgi:chromosomal replication initiator protein